MEKQRWKQGLAVVLLAVFMGVSFFASASLDAISAYASYGFDALFVIAVSLIYRKLEWKTETFTLGFWVAVFFSLAFGFAIYEFASPLGLPIPFPMRDAETLFLLLLVGPVLEEFVFRSALWRLGSEIIKAPWFSYLFTSVLFAFAHYQMIQIAPAEYQGFIRYQAVYTLGLGLLAGGVRLHFGLLGAILIHLAFNFGFFLGSI